MADDNTATENSDVVDSPTIDGPVTDIDPDSQPTDPDESTRTAGTIDADPPAEALKTEIGEPGEGDIKELSEEEIARFDKHPRFQEIIGQRDNARTELTTIRSELDLLKNQVATNVPEKEPEPRPYKDITQMSEEEILDWQSEKPVEFARNLYQQVLYETKATLTAEGQRKKQESSIDKTYQEFGEKNSDFDAMWKTGELTKYINANPGHNAISAYHELKAESLVSGNQKTIDEAITKAVAAKEAEMLKNFKAKKTATVLGGGPAQGPAPIDPELSNTRAKGGLVTTLAARLVALRGG